MFVSLSYWKNLQGLKNEFELAVVNEPSGSSYWGSTV